MEAVRSSWHETTHQQEPPTLPFPVLRRQVLWYFHPRTIYAFKTLMARLPCGVYPMTVQRVMVLFLAACALSRGVFSES